MEDAKIIELFFQRNEQAVKETDTAYGRKLYVLSNNILNNRCKRNLFYIINL